jgi:hypothetical protein
MHVNCPNCGEKVTAENINIQKMTAVCPACDTVFAFDLPEAKAKRRKVKQPAKVNVRDDDTLQMDFWTNFRLDRSEAFISSLIGGISMIGVGLLILSAEGPPPIIPMIILLVGLGFFYSLALTVFNKTHIEMDEESIKIARKPLPNPLNQGHEVSLAGVAAIKYEETEVSKKEGYDTPRYRVWAETTDGRRRTIVNDVTEEYAVFIAQRLEERLQMNADPDVSRLEDRADDEAQEVMRASRSNGKH